MGTHPVTARAALLQALGFPGYGLALIGRVRRCTQGRIRLGVGSVYPALKALERAGLARCEVVRSAGRGGRPKRYYELTLAGVAAANAEREALAALFRGKTSPPTASDLLLMRERLRRCASVSRSVGKLRAALRALPRPR